MLIVVDDARRRRRHAAGADLARLRRDATSCSRRCAQEAHEIVRELLADDIREIKLLQEHIHDGHRPAGLRPHAPPADDPARGGRGMTHAARARAPTGPTVIAEHAVEDVDGAPADRPARRRRGRVARVLPAARALGARRADPSTPGRRQAALRRAADRVETALAGLEQPLGRYLLELEADSAEGRSWFGEPSRAELVDWEPVLDRAASSVDPHRVAAAYLELAVLVRALEGLVCRRALAVDDRPRLALGRACSTCARTCSAARSTTCARSPRKSRA